jgi:hypothetical protein
MQSGYVENLRQAIQKNEKGCAIWPWALDFISAVVCRTILEFTCLLYWDMQRECFWKFRFRAVVATVRTADLCALAWENTKWQGKSSAQ